MGVMLSFEEGIERMVTTLKYYESWLVSDSTDGFNLPVREWDDFGLTLLYAYKPGTNLLTEKTTMLGSEVVEKIVHTYDEYASLIKTVEDDGVAVKITKITPIADPKKPCFGKPREIEEWAYHPQTAEEELLRTTRCYYSKHGFLRRKEIFDSNGVFCFAEETHYDKRDLVCKEVDALGQVTLYDYNKNHNKIFEERVGTGKKTRYRYDFMNRLIETIEELDSGELFSTCHEYDLVGNCTATTDSFGNTTTYIYDKLGRLIETQFPDGSSTKKSYDSLGRTISSVDERGFETTYSWQISLTFRPA